MRGISESAPTVKMSQKLENLYQLARCAKEDNNDENASKYYERIFWKTLASGKQVLFNLL